MTMIGGTIVGFIFRYMAERAKERHEIFKRAMAWKKAEDEKVIEDLVKIKGIGRWTAEMFLIFYLLRPNIFPVDDIGLLRAISINYNLKYPLNNDDCKNQ